MPALRRALLPDDKHRIRLEQFAVLPKLRVDRESDTQAGSGAERALKLCEPENSGLYADDRLFCLALAYHALGRRADAEAAFQKLKALDGDASAYWYARIEAQWGHAAAAMNWLQTAERRRDEALVSLKVRWLLDPIRREPEFVALERRLQFPP